jgi:hypothetical protein
MSSLYAGYTYNQPVVDPIKASIKQMISTLKRRVTPDHFDSIRSQVRLILANNDEQHAYALIEQMLYDEITWLDGRDERLTALSMAWGL